MLRSTSQFLLITFFVNNLYFISCRPKRDYQCNPTDDQFRRFGVHLSDSNRTHPFANVKPVDVDMILPRTSNVEYQCTFPNRLPNDVSLKERAVCPWEWHVNFNKLRIPQSLLEARCRCDKIKEVVRGEFNKHVLRYLECEQVFYSVRVFFFDEECNEYRESVEELALACVAINDSGNQMIMGDYVTERFIPDI